MFCLFYCVFLLIKMIIGGIGILICYLLFMFVGFSLGFD